MSMAIGGNRVGPVGPAVNDPVQGVGGPNSNPTSGQGNSVSGFPGGIAGGGGGFDLGSLLKGFNPLEMIGGLLGGLLGGGQSPRSGNTFDLGSLLSGVMDSSEGIGAGGGKGWSIGNDIGGMLKMFAGDKGGSSSSQGATP